MARKCCVKNCEINGNDVHAVGIPIHRFPKDLHLRSKWLVNAGFDEFYKPFPGQFVCYRHFLKNDYEINKNMPGHKFLLKKGSVPTVFDNYHNHPDPVVPLTVTKSPAKSDNNLPENLIPTNSEMTQLESENLPEAQGSNSKPEELKKEVPKDLLVNSSNKSESIKKSAGSDNLSLQIQNVIDTTVEKKGFTEDPPAEPPPVLDDPVDNVKLNEDSCKSNGDIENNIQEPNGENGKFSKSRNGNSGLTFFVGSKLECKTFSEKWCVAVVVETDWREREILINFDKRRPTTNEWISMDSPRLRSIRPRSSKMREFIVGERVLATWADGRKYPAKINGVLEADKYDVLFDDGYQKIVRGSKITKIASASSKNPSKGMETDAYIGSKQERRDKSRKHTVKDLFSHKKRTKLDGVDQSLTKKDDTSLTDAEQLNNSESMNGSTDAGGELEESITEQVPIETPKPKARNGAKRKREVVVDYDDDGGPEWIDGEPQGIESFVVDGNEGSRRSILIPDKKLPPGWQKHFIQRKTGNSAGKWDAVFLHEASSKKFRSRSDLRSFFETQRLCNFDPNKFDFCVHRRKRPAVAKEKLDSSTSAGSSSATNEPARKIKTLLPKSKTAATNDLLLTSVTPSYLTPVPATPVEDTGGMIYSVFIGGLRVEMEDSAYKCPKEGCFKTFRKENLLQMHIKHYHPEFSKYLGSTPNVADLAYARTIGEPIIDGTPKKSTSNYVDKPTISRGDKRKSHSDKFSTPLAHQSFAASSPLSVASPDMSQIDHPMNGLKDDTKSDLMSPCSNASLDIDDEMAKKSDGSCAMSPGTLFDLKSREEKTQAGIKTLLPLRSANSADTTRLDRSKSLDDTFNADRGQRKRQLSEYSSDNSTKSKKRHGIQELTDDYGDLDDSAMDIDGPSPLVYRFSRRKSDSKSDDNSQNGECMMMMINGEMVKVEQLKREEIINCTCGIVEEDGLMIQCDLCLCWQHGHCNSIEREKDVPEKYICFICQNSYRQRPSKKYAHDQDWIKEGKLPSLTNRHKNQETLNKRFAMLKRSNDLVGALLKVQQVLYSLKVKIGVAQVKDHPKLYLWAKNWETTELPKPHLEPVPILEIIKPEPTTLDMDITQSDIKPEGTCPINKDDINGDKSIHSDSELMKILEEDNSCVVDDLKVKKEISDSKNIEESPVVKNETETPQTDKIEDIKIEDSKENIKEQPNVSGTDSQVQFNASNNNESLNDSKSEQAKSKPFESLPEQPPAPQQPFIPEPEAPIDPDECRLRLLNHIEHFQNHMEVHLTSVESQVSFLEAMDPDDDLAADKVDIRCKETIQMVIRDLHTVRKLAALC
ncbi:PHD finger protein 20-like protein 1 isoform X3 [Cotesia glomerata]|uniref:PHD finger protein 20-like protein 1 isoform X3 n=1 Tax=Cotesia glomerata TaxID=32391 RepID=UPI001D014021|nr:PHD finger protein 20-like protein 1 isoform X3 [Cotesia glomerata]